MAYNKESQMKATAKYKAKVGRVQVSLELNLEDREEWKAYADAQGLKMTAMVRQAVKESMVNHGWQRDGWKKEVKQE